MGITKITILLEKLVWNVMSHYKLRVKIIFSLISLWSSCVHKSHERTTRSILQFIRSTRILPRRISVCVLEIVFWVDFCKHYVSAGSSKLHPSWAAFLMDKYPQTITFWSCCRIGINSAQILLSFVNHIYNFFPCKILQWVSISSQMTNKDIILKRNSSRS